MRLDLGGIAQRGDEGRGPRTPAARRGVFTREAVESWEAEVGRAVTVGPGSCGAPGAGARSPGPAGTVGLALVVPVGRLGPTALGSATARSDRPRSAQGAH